MSVYSFSLTLKLTQGVGYTNLYFSVVFIRGESFFLISKQAHFLLLFVSEPLQWTAGKDPGSQSSTTAGPGRPKSSLRTWSKPLMITLSLHQSKNHTRDVAVVTLSSTQFHISATLKPHKSIFVDLCKCDGDALIAPILLIILLESVAAAASLSGFR